MEKHGGKIEKIQKEKKPWNICEKNSTFDIQVNNGRQDFPWPYQRAEERCTRTSKCDSLTWKKLAPGDNTNT